MRVLPTTSNHATAALFTTAMLRALSSPSPWEAVRRITDAGIGPMRAPLGEVFDRIYAELSVTRPSEYIYKNGLVSKIVFGRHRPSTAAATVELPTGASVADLLIVNGTSTIYEVKTDLDSFARLRTQLADYSRLAENVYLVTSARRVGQALAATPSHVGVLGIDRRGRIAAARQAPGGLERITPNALHAVLRTAERKQILTDMGIQSEFMQSADVRHVFLGLSVNDLHPRTVDLLRSRFSAPATLVSQSSFPRSLRALAYGVPMSAAAQRRLTTRLSHLPAEVQFAA